MDRCMKCKTLVVCTFTSIILNLDSCYGSTSNNSISTFLKILFGWPRPFSKSAQYKWRLVSPSLSPTMLKRLIISNISYQNHTQFFTH